MSAPQPAARSAASQNPSASPPIPQAPALDALERNGRSGCAPVQDIAGSNLDLAPPIWTIVKQREPQPQPKPQPKPQLCYTCADVCVALMQLVSWVQESPTFLSFSAPVQPPLNFCKGASKQLFRV